MKRILFLAILISSTLWAQNNVNNSNRGLEISLKAEQFNNGFIGDQGEMEMEIINAYGDSIKRKMIRVSSETKNDGDKSVIKFLWPLDVKDTRLLTWTHKNKNDSQWLYMPSIKRVKRINSRNQSGSFMGSEFYYEDLNSQEIEKYTHKYIKDIKYQDRDCWLIERVPHDKNSGYSKIVSWLDKQYYNPLKIEYYDRKGELLKTADFKGYKQYKKWWRQSEIFMMNHQTKKSSRMVWKNLKLSIKHSSKSFTKSRFKKL
jgi:hypothetical protein